MPLKVTSSLLKKKKFMNFNHVGCLMSVLYKYYTIQIKYLVADEQLAAKFVYLHLNS